MRGSRGGDLRLVERTATPVFTSASGRGVLPEQSLWCLGYDSLRGSTDQLNAFLRETDLVIAMGARLAFNGTAEFRVTLPSERLVHVGASTGNLNAVYPASSAAISAEAFLAMAESGIAPRTAWTPETLAPWRTRIRAVYSRDWEPTIAGQTPQQFFGRMRAELPDNALVVTDSGLHQVWPGATSRCDKHMVCCSPPTFNRWVLPCRRQLRPNWPRLRGR